MRRMLLALAVSLAATLPLRAAEGTLDSNGVKIHYVVEGEGEPVVLIHGFAGNIPIIWSLPGTLKALAKDYRVIALDCRGHGKSDKPLDPKKYGLELVEDVVRLMDHLKIPKAHVVGYSMGSVITLKLLTKYPERVRSATLAGGGQLWPDSEDLFTKELPEALEQGKGFMPLIARLAPKEKPPTEQQLQLINQVMVAMNEPKALAALLRGSRALLVEEAELKTIKAPVLLLIGAIDPLREAIEPLKKLPNVTYAVIKDADHLTTFTRPDFVVNVKAFLAKQR